MLSVKQGSCEYQFLGHWFDPTRNQNQKQTLYPIEPSDRFHRQTCFVLEIINREMNYSFFGIVNKFQETCGAGREVEGSIAS